MRPEFQELLSQLSEAAREIATDCQYILNGPPQWDVILATHERLSRKTTHFPRTAEFTFENDRRSIQQRAHVTIVLAGATEDFQGNGVKLVLKFHDSPSLFIYLFDQSRRRGTLVDVNFIRHSATLQAGEDV